MGRLSKRLLTGSGIVVLGLVIAIFAIRAYQAEDIPQAETELTFTQAKLNFSHAFDAKKILPFLGSAAFDANGDGQVDLFLGGGLGQDDGIFTYEKGAFVPLISPSKNLTIRPRMAQRIWIMTRMEILIFSSHAQQALSFSKIIKGRSQPLQSVSQWPKILFRFPSHWATLIRTIMSIYIFQDILP